MDVISLVGPPSSLGYPAPYWFLVMFKVLGFILHMMPMNLVYVGLILALVMRRGSNENARHWSNRFARHTPFIVAWAVNLGIVPLLFTQVAYHQVFYPATILMAWAWFSIIPLLALAYYGVYIYASGLRPGAKPAQFKQAAGWISAVFFILIGFLFASGFSLMTNVGAWHDLWQKTSVAGAPLGIAHNFADPALWPRWLMMLGLALTTTASYVIVDTGWFADRESDAYKHWTTIFALRIYTIGLVLFAVAGTWYAFGAWREDVQDQMLGTPLAILTVLTAIGPALPWLLIVRLSHRGGMTRGYAFGIGLSQIAVLSLNAISRQIVQNIELSKFLDLRAQPVNIQWSPLILFLALFVAGLGLLAWMIFKVLSRQSAGTGDLH